MIAVRQKATLLRSLHRRGTPVLLPNAWDAHSARRVVAAGFPVVATSSGAVAASLGFEDGEAMPADEAFEAVRRIAACVDAPVTADIEAGYGLDPTEVAQRLVEAGACGCNFEDTDHAAGRGVLREAGEQAARIAALREAGGDALVINARVDLFIGRRDAPVDVVDEAIERARRYVEAGADCVYPIILADEAAISRVVESVDAPVNIMLRPGAPPVARLTEIGVARISMGSGLHRAAASAIDAALADLAGQRTDPS